MYRNTERKDAYVLIETVLRKQEKLLYVQRVSRLSFITPFFCGYGAAYICVLILWSVFRIFKPISVLFFVAAAAPLVYHLWKTAFRANHIGFSDEAIFCVRNLPAMLVERIDWRELDKLTFRFKWLPRGYAMLTVRKKLDASTRESFVLRWRMKLFPYQMIGKIDYIRMALQEPFIIRLVVPDGGKLLQAMKCSRREIGYPFALYEK